jgi:TRAP-type C4-dicarboxylate transport system, periplasmic component
MKTKARATMLVSSAAAGALLLAACSGGSDDAGSAGETVTIQVGFENTLEEPIGQAVEEWAELVAERSDGTIRLDLFPNSSLGSKNELIDQMVLGESVVTIADGAFYADQGAPDMGIMYGPFFFETWDDVWTLLDSDWYAEQSDLLAQQGLTLLASNWVYGERHLMTNDPVSLPSDLVGKKIRLANTKIYIDGFAALGATPVGMDLGDVYSSLQTGVIDGVENPLSTLYGRSFQEVSKNILLTGHIKNFTTWVAGTSFMDSLTDEQREILTSTAEEAGIYNNELQAEADSEYEQLLTDAGVTITPLTDAELAQWVDAGLSFYDKGDEFGWSPDLFEVTQRAMGK